MRKHQPPWSVRGVSQEARAKAAKAAQRRRMTIGEWVDTTLIAAANAELGSGGPRPTEAFSGATSAPASPAAPSGAGGALAAAPADGALAETLTMLSGKIEKAEAAGEAVVAIVERLDGVARATRALETLAARFSDLDRRDRRLLAIAERLVANERKNEQRLAVLASAMNVLAQKIDRRAAEQASKVTADDLARALDALKRSIDELASRVDETTPVAVIEPPPRPARENGRGPTADEDLPVFDYDVLNEHAIRNTRRGGEDDAPARRGFVSRLFGGG